MTAHHNAKWTDEQMLEALHLRDVVGMTSPDVGKRFGVSKGAILGLEMRVRQQTDAVDVSPHLNGTMPPQWWREGLRRRK